MWVNKHMPHFPQRSFVLYVCTCSVTTQLRSRLSVNLCWTKFILLARITWLIIHWVSASLSIAVVTIVQQHSHLIMHMWGIDIGIGMMYAWEWDSRTCELWKSLSLRTPCTIPLAILPQSVFLLKLKFEIQYQWLSLQGPCWMYSGHTYVATAIHEALQRSTLNILGSTIIVFLCVRTCGLTNFAIMYSLLAQQIHTDLYKYDCDVNLSNVIHYIIKKEIQMEPPHH